jgi:3-methyladenine DNA glycosylase/8-oxoguanine DNA glycosylase
MADRLGEEVDVHGDRRHAFPSPARLAALEGLPGLFAGKVENLRLLREVAAVGILDGARLRALPREQALAELKRFPGIGDYRTWVVLLLRVLLEAETGEDGGTRDVGGRPR